MNHEMTEPQFTVPLSALVEIEHVGSGWSLGCCLYDGYAICKIRAEYPSESAARAAAVAHLESVHGIRAASSVRTERAVTYGPDDRPLHVNHMALNHYEWATENAPHTKPALWRRTTTVSEWEKVADE